MIYKAVKRFVAPTGRGSVLVIAMLLLSSATLRLATSANTALAQGSPLPTTAMPATPSHPDDAVQPEADMVQQTPRAAMAGRDEIAGLIKALTMRETLLATREKQLEMRMQALSVADAEIEKRIAALTETEAALRATLSLADEASENDLLRLTSVYESMKPKDAAALFEEMEPNFAAGFIGRMRPDVAAEVMAGLSPQVAYSISVILAGRNATVPKT